MLLLLQLLLPGGRGGAGAPLGGPVLVVRILAQVQQPQPLSLLNKGVAFLRAQPFPPPANKRVKSENKLLVNLL